MQIHANDANNKKDKVLFMELSYRLTGLCFKVYNKLWRYSKEKQYTDALHTLLEQEEICFKREKNLPSGLVPNNFTNVVDFVIEDKLLLDTKAKKFVVKDDCYQMQRYLNAANIKLGLIVNLRDRYLKPIRVI